MQTVGDGDVNLCEPPKANTMSDVTIVLQRINDGDSIAAHELAPMVYSELHRLAAGRMAREREGHTLQATALVHEAWMRLGDGVFANRAHFFGAAASAMRQILVDRARRKLSRKGSGKTDNPLFPALRSGHRLFQRPRPKSKFLDPGTISEMGRSFSRMDAASSSGDRKWTA